MKRTIKQMGLLFSLFALLFIGCKTEKAETAEVIPGIVLENMDTSVSPKNDFYNYVNGNWMKVTEIPEDRTSWGGFGVLRKSTDADVLAILDEAKTSGTYAATSDQGKALLLFESIMDEAARNEIGLAPLQEALQKIDAIESVVDLQTLIAKDPIVSAPFMGFTSFPDLNDSSVNAPYVSTGGLGLPDRDYYLKNDANSVEIREKYVVHITRMLQFIGSSKEDAKEDAEKILALETRLVTPQFDKIQSRDARNFNNPRSIADLSKIVPAVQWEKFFTDLGVSKKLDTVMVLQPKYMEELQKVLAEGDIELWKIAARWSTLNNSTNRLTTEIETANWEFYSKELRGAKEQRPADERALARVNGNMGEALGQLYVDAKFPPEAKAKAELMISNVIEAYKARIQNLDWMSDSTKIKAIEKLDKFTVKIGYPNDWEDYSDVAIEKGNSLFENMVAINDWAFKKNIAEIGEPVDKTEWGMSPQTVNAYFNPLNNEIVFPAAILQPPFYNYQADEAVNYGGIGAVIGHEISHAFDDSGARFDSDGNLVNWWTEGDLTKFTERGNALASQYDAIEVLDSVYINGKFTLGENIGDLGGVLGAYDGLQRFYKENGKPEPIDGLTAEQRFFISWTTVWRTKTREEALRTQIKTDPHSPGIYRATQPLLNVDAFYEAFDIKEGDAMFLPESERVRIW